MDPVDVEKIFDLKLDLIKDMISASDTKTANEFAFVRLQVAEVDKRLDRIAAIWKWILGILTCIITSVLIAIIIQAIL